MGVNEGHIRVVRSCHEQRQPLDEFDSAAPVTGETFSLLTLDRPLLSDQKWAYVNRCPPTFAGDRPRGPPSRPLT